MKVSCSLMGWDPGHITRNLMAGALKFLVAAVALKFPREAAVFGSSGLCHCASIDTDGLTHLAGRPGLGVAGGGLGDGVGARRCRVPFRLQRPPLPVRRLRRADSKTYLQVSHEPARAIFGRDGSPSHLQRQPLAVWCLQWAERHFSDHRAYDCNHGMALQAPPQ